MQSFVSVKAYRHVIIVALNLDKVEIYSTLNLRFMFNPIGLETHFIGTVVGGTVVVSPKISHVSGLP